VAAGTGLLEGLTHDDVAGATLSLESQLDVDLITILSYARNGQAPNISTRRLIGRLKTLREKSGYIPASQPLRAEVEESLKLGVRP
jgi:hypothetical protein